MRKQQKRRIRQQAQAILFCSILVWMAASFIAAVPAMAFQPETKPTVFHDYASVVRYQEYAYASEGPRGAEAIAHKENGSWQILCEASTPMSGIDLVQNCDLPVGMARHLKVLSHEGMSHDIVVPNVFRQY